MITHQDRIILSQHVSNYLTSASRICYIQSWWWDLLPYTLVTLLFYIIGTIIVSTMVETKAGKVREKMKTLAADGKGSKPYATKKEWLLLDMTQTDFPVYKSEYLYWDAVIMVRKLLLGKLDENLDQEVLPVDNCPSVVLHQKFARCRSRKRASSI
jgi:hypothetical protein